jgi:4-hydroxy-2-oxoheptanedioate aldolase
MGQRLLREEMQENGPTLGFCITYPSPGVIERVGPDWDWLWLDGQHGELSYESILACVRAAELVKVPAIIRVADHEYGSIGRALDMGAAGVMVPMIDDAEEAKNVVEAAKFAPLGQRSFGGRRAIDLFGRRYPHIANNDTLLITQIETKKGLANAAAIAAVPGIDVLFLGPDDLALQDGWLMDQTRPIDFYAKALEKMALAAKNAGKIAGTVAATPEILELAVEMGYQLLVVSWDFSLLASGSKNVRVRMDEVTQKALKRGRVNLENN